MTHTDGNCIPGGAPGGSLVKCPTPDFGSGHGLRAVRTSPRSGCTGCRISLRFSFHLPQPPTPFSFSHSLSLGGGKKGGQQGKCTTGGHTSLNPAKAPDRARVPPPPHTHTASVASPEHTIAPGCFRLPGTISCQSCEQNVAACHQMQAFPNNPDPVLMTQPLMTAQTLVAATNLHDSQ